jgi:hypothetical protein
MYEISRIEHYVHYWWSGSEWVTSHHQAKLFETRDEAFSEIERRAIRGGVQVHERRPGRPPAAGTQPQVIVSITMPQAYRDWLDAHGDRSSQIRRLIERAIEEEAGASAGPAGRLRRRRQ